MIRPGRSKGSALIEFAGSLMLLSAVFAGVFQIGYAFYTYNTLVNAVRAGARYAAMQPRGAAAANAELAKAVGNLVVYGDPAPAAAARPVVAGLTADQVELIMDPASCTVSIRGFEVDSVFARVKLDGKPTVTFPVTEGGAR